MAQHAPPSSRTSSVGARRNPEGNARLTAGTGALLFVLFAVEGLTILSVGSLLTPHIWVGVLLLGPVALKTATTTWRFARYYRGDRAYVEKGPPALLLRLLGPFVVLLSFAVILTGIGLVIAAPSSWHDRLLLLHKVSFVLWFGAMTIHVLGHLLETATLAPRDWLARTRNQVAGASWRKWALVGSLLAGLALAAWIGPHASGYLVTSH
jgi:hypothetical protein